MVTQKQLQKELNFLLDSFALIFKSRKGNWRVMWKLTDEEDEEVKSIILSKLAEKKLNGSHNNPCKEEK